MFNVWNLSTILLDASAKSPSKNSLYMQLIFIAGFILIFYLFFISPQRKQQKEKEKNKKNLSAGQEIITIGGIHGKIVSVHQEEQTCIIQIDEHTKIKLNLAAIGDFKIAKEKK